jgi:hypothetical protein
MRGYRSLAISVNACTQFREALPLADDLPASRYIMIREAREVDVIPAFLFGGKTAVRMATMIIKTPIMNEPPSREPRRPIRSTRKIRKNRQETTLATPKKPLIMREFSPAPTALKICGEKYARDVLPVSWTPAKESRQ